MIKSQQLDGERMALFPSLDYKQLYNALTQMVDVASSIHIGLPGLSLLFYHYCQKIVLYKVYKIRSVICILDS